MTYDFEEKKNVKILRIFILRQGEERELKQRKNEKNIKKEDWFYHLQITTTLAASVSIE